MITIKKLVQNEPNIEKFLEFIAEKKCPIYKKDSNCKYYIQSTYDSVWISKDKLSQTGWYVGNEIFNFLIDETSLN